MKLISKNKDYKLSNKTVVTIGTFDGIHLGHQQLLSTLNSIAKKKNAESCVITFDPHPRTVVSKEFDFGLLTSPDEKIKFFEELKIDNLIVVEFTEEFSQTTYEKFIKEFILDRINTEHIVIGYDHKFGKNRSGDVAKLTELAGQYKFNVTQVDQVNEGDQVISSSAVRNLLYKGDIIKANYMLGRYYQIWGKVVEGTKRGRQLGFPTANIEVNFQKKIIPLGGVYAVRCKINSLNYIGIMNIGTRPTFGESANNILEIHLLDFNKDIYGEDIVVEIIARLRDERKFESKEELIKQIQKDKSGAIELLNNKLIN